MITEEHIKTFKHFHGDIDGWTRMKKSGDTMTDKIWTEIESALQNFALVDDNLASETFKYQTLKHLKNVGATDEAVEALLKLSQRH
jgi:hypothetical protein